MRIGAKLVALGAIVALVLTYTAGDPSGSPDDPDDEAAIAFHLSPVLPPARLAREVVLEVTAAVSVEDRPVAGRLAELDIFRPPRACA